MLLFPFSSILVVGYQLGRSHGHPPATLYQILPSEAYLPSQEGIWLFFIYSNLHWGLCSEIILDLAVRLLASKINRVQGIVLRSIKLPGVCLSSKESPLTQLAGISIYFTGILSAQIRRLDHHRTFRKGRYGSLLLNPPIFFLLVSHEHHLDSGVSFPISLQFRLGKWLHSSSYQTKFHAKSSLLDGKFHPWSF